MRYLTRFSPVATLATTLALTLTFSPPASADIVINEIHYNGEPNTAVNEFVELHNTGPSPVDLGGWAFVDGIEYTFPPGTSIPSGGFTVVAERPSSLLSEFGVSALGPYLGGLNSDGERVRLVNATGQTVDEVTYQSRFPWPIGADGSGSSMELTHPGLDNDLAGAWRAASLGGVAGPPPAPLVPLQSTWKYFKGTSEASSPATAWRQIGFNDASWLAGQAPFYFEDDANNAYDAGGNTDLTDMRNNYSTLYMRHSFNVSNPALYAGLLATAQADDGCIVWLNGVEISRLGAPAGELSNTAVATDSTGEPKSETTPVPNPATLLVVGQNVLAMQALNASLGGSSDFWAEAELRSPEPGEAEGTPTPGATNSTFVLNAPPFIRQVDHAPQQPASSEATIITARVTDADGVGSVTLEYQIVAPGAYVPAYLAKPINTLLSSPNTPNDPNPAYAANWISLSMTDNGANGDATPGDDVYSATIAARPNRTLVRYRISVEDTLGARVRVPYPDDKSLNFAYFVYNGVPAYTAETRSVISVGHTYPSELMTSLPVYHLLTTPADFDQAVNYNGANTIPSNNFDAREAYNWSATFVYDGEVYDNIGYRLRQRNARYSGSGKRSFKFRFNPGNKGRFRDNDGNRYSTDWSRLSTHKMLGSRGNATWGMLESASHALFNAYGVPASFTHWFHFRVVRGAEEAPTGANGQYLGDFYGLLLALEEFDNDFLDAHKMEKGNLYKLISGRTDGVSVRRYLEKDSVDDGSDFQNIIFNLRRSQPDSFLREHVNYDEWNRYHAIVDAIRHYDVAENTGEHLKNRAYYFEKTPGTTYGRLWLLPWDTDTTWGPNWNAGIDWPKSAIINPDRVEFTREYSNVMREVRDLIWTEEQIDLLLDSLAARIAPLVPADRDRWINGINGSQNHPPIETLVADMKKFAFIGRPGPGAGEIWVGGNGPLEAISKDSGISGAEGRDAFLEAWALDPQIPSTPIVTSSAPGGFPVNRLTFQTANYSGTHPFAAWNWRIAEITPTNQLGSLTAAPLLEAQSVWESGDITDINSRDITIPQELLRVGRVYRVRARAWDNSGRASHWSSPFEFTSGEPDSATIMLSHLRLSELMFNSPGGNDFDFVELQNTSSTTPIDLAGARFTQGIEFTFPPGTILPPDGYIVVIGTTNETAFRNHYGSSPALQLAGPYDQNLSNAGERLVLRTSVGGTDIVAFDYADSRGWPIAADGSGHSLIPLTTAGQASGTLNYGGNWRSSTFINGSPGQPDPEPAPSLLINEVTAHTDAEPPFDSNDWIELHNPTTSDITLPANWFLSDDGDPANLTKWMIPQGTLIPAGGFVSFDETSGFHNPPETGFGLNKAGERVYLSHLPGNSQDRVVDSVRFKGQENGLSAGRYPDGGPYWFDLLTLTRNAANAAPPIRPVITELMYHPPDADGFDDNTNEYVEIFNPGPSTVDLFNTNGSWRLDGGVGFVLPENTTLNPMEYLILVNFDPADSAALDLFRIRYSLDPAVPIVGPYSGSLNNSTDRVALERPQAPDLPEDPISWVIVDETIYGDQSPWQIAADGFGSSLHRLDLMEHGNAPGNWQAAAPTAGGPYGGGVPPTITLQPEPPSQTSPAGANISYTVQATGTEPLSYLWLFDGSALPQTGPTLTLMNVQPPNSGTYSAIVLNPAGSALSDQVVLNVTTPPRINASPVPFTGSPGDDALFTVNASGSGVLVYQWRKNGLNIPGANSASLSITNIQASDDATYTVVVADLNGSVISDPARLTVLVPPSFVIHPISQSVIQGGSVTFSVQTEGTLPMGFRWRRGGATVRNVVLNSHFDFLTITNAQSGNAGRYTVIATNEAFYLPGVPSSFGDLVVLADLDGDGMDDTWETNNGLDPGNPSDAAENDDGDLLSNKEEYDAGTDPQDPGSFLKIDSLTQEIGPDGPVRIRFLAVSNKTYTVEFNEALLNGFWSRLIDVPATPTNRVVELEDLGITPGNPERYYRLVTPRQP